MRNDAIIVICSRTDSKRIPNKVFRMINGKPAIRHLLDRLGDEFKIVLAVPQNQAVKYISVLDDKYPNVRIWESTNEFFDASPLHRMAAVMNEYSAIPFIIRITHDDILVDIQTIRETLELMKKDGTEYECSPKIIEGAGAEIIATKTLIRAANEYNNPSEYVSYHVKPNDPLKITYGVPRREICRNYNLCMDYPADVTALETIFRNVGNNASLNMIVEFIDRHKWILDINKRPKLSIYSCTYNSSKYIDEMLASIFPYRMNLEDVEYVFVDDFSRDDTLNHLADFSIRKNVKIICNEKNLGLGSSANTAISNCMGKHILRIDSDDIVIWNGLMAMINLMDEKEPAIIYPDYFEMYPDEGIYKDGVQVKGNVFHHAGGALMNRRMINELKFREGLRHWDGMELLLKLKKLNFDIAYSDTPAFKYRMRPESLSHESSEERENAKQEVELLSGK